MKLFISKDKSKPAHPFVFLVLALPQGIWQGYATITLAYVYSKAGISVENIAVLIATTILPPIFKFLWAPLIDLTLTVKKWYYVSVIVVAAIILGISFIPVRASILPLLNMLFLLLSFAGTFISMSVTSLMAYDTSDDTKGRAGGYFNGGAVGGIGVGGGFGLWLAERLASGWLVGAVLALTCLACCVTLLYVKEPAITIRVKKVSQTMVNLFKDIWAVLKKRAGVLALFLCFLPFGTGAAGSLFATVAKDWSASANTVALITGTLGGIITVAGCLLGGWVCDKINRQLAYVLFGLSQGFCAIGMAFCPHTEFMYIAWTSLYSLSNGLAYAGFTAFVLEAIGKGAAATKYNIYAGLSNTPIYFMTLIDGWAHTRWGATGMLTTEAVAAGAGVVLFFGFKSLNSIRRQAIVVVPVEEGVIRF
jgi:PAT family beta-lactamase induction signal transducer AmpG